MIITIICAIIFITGIILAYIDDKYYIWKDWFFNCELWTFILGAIGTVFCIIVIIGNHVCIDKQIAIDQMRYESLQARVEVINSDYEDVSKSDVIRDVIEWNQNLYSKKYYASNPWFSWFESKRYVDQFDYIDLPVFEGQ